MFSLRVHGTQLIVVGKSRGQEVETAGDVMSTEESDEYVLLPRSPFLLTV